MHPREIGGRLMFLLLLRRNILQRGGETGLHPSQLPILEALAHHPDCTQQALADFLHVTPASVALSTKRLEKAGLIEKHTDKTDKRRNRLCITEQGRQLSLEHRRSMDALDADMLKSFTEEEKQTLSALLERMIENLGASADHGLPCLSCNWKENNE